MQHKIDVKPTWDFVNFIKPNIFSNLNGLKSAQKGATLIAICHCKNKRKRWYADDGSTYAISIVYVFCGWKYVKKPNIVLPLHYFCLN